MAVWDKYGLVSFGFFRGRARDLRYSQLPRANRFKLALEEKGGLFNLFGHFLAGRADLLPNPHLRQLQKVKPHRDPSGRSMADRELSGRVADLRPMRAAPGAEIFSGFFQDEPAVVEFYSKEADPFTLCPWKSFINEIHAFDGEVEAGIARRPVLDQFREWLELARDIGRKRLILENLDRIPAGCVTRYPRLVGELQTGNCLVYAGLAQGSPELERLAS